MLSCDKRLPLDTWNLSGLQENVFANPRSTLESSQIPDRGIHQFATLSAIGEVPVLIRSGAPGAREEERIGNTIPMPTFASRPSTIRSFALLIFHRVLWLDSKDSRYRNFNLINSLLHHLFYVGRLRFRNQVTTRSDPSLGSYVVDQRGGDGRFNG